MYRLRAADNNQVRPLCISGGCPGYQAVVGAYLSVTPVVGERFNLLRATIQAHSGAVAQNRCLLRTGPIAARGRLQRRVRIEVVSEQAFNPGQAGRGGGALGLLGWAWSAVVWEGLRCSSAEESMRIVYFTRWMQQGRAVWSRSGLVRSQVRKRAA